MADTAIHPTLFFEQGRAVLADAALERWTLRSHAPDTVVARCNLTNCDLSGMRWDNFAQCRIVDCVPPPEGTGEPRDCYVQPGKTLHLALQ